MGDVKYYGKDFFTYEKRLYHIQNEYVHQLIEEKGVPYCVDKGLLDEVFGGFSDWSGDPWEEPSYYAKFDEDLFNKFLATIEPRKESE